MSATPLETASNTSKALTSCPAPKTWTLTRPPVIAVIARPSLSALLPRPGRPFGQLVTILSSRAPCAMAGAGNVAATPATVPAWVKKLRRSMARFLGFFVFLGDNLASRLVIKNFRRSGGGRHLVDPRKREHFA